LAVFVVLGSAAEARCQAPTTLDGVEDLVREGRTEEARQALLRWWRTGYRDASRTDVQQGLWLRAQLTVDPRQASLDYRRLVVEYPGGGYADMALLRLAQSAFALGDSAAAAAHVARLQRDYPIGSPAREAEAWWAEPGPVPPPGAQHRDEAAQPDPFRDTGPELASGSGVATEPQVAVQLGAFAMREGAEAVHREVTDAGFSARIVRIGSDGLYRVRVGMFQSSDEAAEILRRLRQLGFSAAVARDAHLEEPIGR
jgi:hypothetical protein